MKLPLPFTSGDDDRVITITLIEGEALAAACVVLAAVIAIVTDVGGRAGLAYYGTVAQVIPVFLIALMVEIRSRLDRSMASAVGALEQREREYEVITELEREVRGAGATGTDLDKAGEQLRAVGARIGSLKAELRGYMPQAQRIVRGYVTIAVPGEAAALAVLAAGRGNTFALSLGALSLIAMVLLYIRTLGMHYELDED